MAHRAHVAHHMRGRMRLKLPAGKDNAPLLGRIKQSLSPLPGIRRVDVNPTTGSVVVEYDADQHDDFHAFLGQLAEREHLFSLAPPPVSMAEDIETKIEQEAEFLAGHSRTARVVVQFFLRVNRELRQATDNNLDLKVLFPLTLAVYSLLHRRSAVATPLWVTLGVSSFNAFIALHYPKGTTGTQRELVTDAGDGR